MRPRTGLAAFVTVLGTAGVLAATAGTGTAAFAASASGNKVKAGDLLVSGTIFQQPDIVAGQTQLPPGCAAANCATAVADGPTVRTAVYGELFRGVSFAPGT